MLVLEEVTHKELRELPLPSCINEDTPIDDEDKELIKKAIKALGIYLDLLHDLPPSKWRALSYANRVTWNELGQQDNLLEDIVKKGYIPGMDT